MAERLNKCLKCGNYQYIDIIVMAHNPETLDVNMRATLRCCNEECSHQWEGRVTSPHYEKQRKRGLIL